MCRKVFVCLCVAITFSSTTSTMGHQADNCTSGFMNMDRIEAAVQGGADAEDHILGEVYPFTSINRQAILPYMNFTCDGSILSWTFGARWGGNPPRHTELQIWRSSGNDSYTKVGSTTIMLEAEGSTRLYQYTLTSPLPFQAGDILGFFQGSVSTSQITLLFEDVGSDQLLHYVIQESPSSQFIMENSVTIDRYHVIIGIQTDSVGCDCGFMSLERMRILLGLDTVGDRISTERRQQISPDITFTCEGLITKWILGADWDENEELYPELQVWRNVGNNTFHKINGTVINIMSKSPTRIYEYDNFPPIPVLAGDILGVFIPEALSSKLLLWSERDNGPTVYYVDTDSATESSGDAIDLQHMPSLSSATYLPLVTVEISARNPTHLASFQMTTSSIDVNNPTSLASLLKITSSLSPASTINVKSSTLTTLPPEPVATPPISAMEFSTTMAVYTTSPPHVNGVNVSLFVGVGVAGTLLVFITAAVIITTLLVFLRKKKMNVPNKVAYLSSTSEIKLISNSAYTTVRTHNLTSHTQEHMPNTTTAIHVTMSTNKL